MAPLGRFPKMSVAEAHQAFAKAALAVSEGGDPAREIAIANSLRDELRGRAILAHHVVRLSDAAAQGVVGALAVRVLEQYPVGIRDIRRLRLLAPFHRGVVYMRPTCIAAMLLVQRQRLHAVRGPVSRL